MQDKAKDNANSLDIVNAAKEEVGVSSTSSEYVFNRSATVMHRENYSEFRKANMAFLSDGASKIGGAIKSVERMRVNKPEMDKYMPALIGEDVRSVEYNKKFDEYFSNFTVIIPAGGKTLDTSFRFKSVESYNVFKGVYKNILAKFASAIDGITEGEDRDKQVDAAYKVKDESIVLLESKLHNHGEPVNVGEYILWRYCLVYRDVANDEVRMTKSINIRFYLFDAKLKQQQEEAAFEIQSTATVLYADLLTNQEELEHVVWALSNVHTMDIRSSAKGQPGHNTRAMMLDKVVKADPQNFLAIAKHKDLKVRSFIEKAVAYGMINRIPNTQVLMDKEGNTIGSTLAESIVFFKNREINGEYISRIENQIKSI